MMGKPFLVTLISVSLLATSAAGQKNPKAPQVTTPDTFRGSEITSPADQTSIGDLKWFDVFKDGELQRLVRTAMIQNYDLRTATARINAARANLGLARSDQFPQIGASTDVTTTRDSKNGQFGAFGQRGRTRSFGSFFLNLFTFELDIWG